MCCFAIGIFVGMVNVKDEEGMNLSNSWGNQIAESSAHKSSGISV